MENAGLRVIAILKIAKGLLLLGLGFGIFRLINADLGELARNWAIELRIDPENRYVQFALEKIARVDAHTLRRFGLLSLLFSADLFVEGVGLWLNKTWAKYLVLIATGAFIPIEVNACIRHSTFVHWLLLALNCAVVGYIAHHLWSHRRRSAA